MSSIIEVENLSKMYRLGVIGSTTLHQSLERWWYTKIGRPELAKKIGSKEATISPDDPQAGEEPNTFWALKDISFSIKKGEVLGLIGKNGAGKSTLLKVLSRITDPTSGRAVLRGSVASLLEVGTGFHPELTGRENVYLNGSILGMRKTEIDRKFDEIVGFAELEKFIDTPVKRYSSGMYVRLAFSVAAHLEPDILLVDEVLAVGDLVFRKKCLGKMGDVAKEGRTVIFVSHNMSAVENLCPSAILLDRGKIVLKDETEKVINHYLEISKEHTKEQGMNIFFEEDVNKVMQFRNIYISDEENNNIEQIDNTKSFRTNLEIEIKEFKEGSHLVWILRGADYKVLCFSMEHDLKEGVSSISGQGTYKAFIDFPGNILNAGLYTLELLIVDRMRTVSYDLQKIDVFVSNHQEFGLDKRKGGQRKGQLLMPLKWEVNKV
jgi:lipopolysaccharide transport system ATP-binding protein